MTETPSSSAATLLHPGGVYGGSDLDRWADANATLAGLFRRVFMRVER